MCKTLCRSFTTCFVFATGDGEGGGGKREDYSEEDVEYYFNYSGILAERGSYDSMEDLLSCKSSIMAPAMHTSSALLSCHAVDLAMHQ